MYSVYSTCSWNCGDRFDFGHLFLNRMIVISFELEKVEFRMFIPVIPLPEKSQKELLSKICT